MFKDYWKRRYEGRGQKLSYAFSVSDVLLTYRASLRTETRKPDLDRAESSPSCFVNHRYSPVKYIVFLVGTLLGGELGN